MSQRLIHVRDFARELVTNADEGDIPENAASVFENMRADQLGKARGIPGSKKFADGPTDIAGNLNWHGEAVVNDTQVLFSWGEDSNSVQHLYYSADGGTTWIELTEIKFLDVDSVTSTTIFSLVAGSSPFDGTPSSSDDEYNGWWLYYHDVSTPANDDFDYVLDYTGSTKQITTLWGVTGVASADKIILMRFPLWNKADLQDIADGTLSDFDDHRNFVRSGFKPSIIQRDEAVLITMGRSKDNLTAGVDNHTGLWFGHINKTDFFGDTNLAWNDYHCERRFLDRPNRDTVATDRFGTLSAIAETGDPLTAATYAIWYAPIYDGFQEAPVFFDQDENFASTIRVIATNELLRVTFEVKRFGIGMLFHDHGSRRFTQIRLYIAQVSSVGGSNFKAISPFFFVKDVDVQDISNWSGSGTVGSPYTQDVDIFDRDFAAGKANEAQFVHGYFDEVRVSSDFTVQVEGREIAGSIVTNIESDNEESTAHLISSAINSAFRNTPDALPEGNIKDTGEESLYKIQALKEIGSRLACFGENRLNLYQFNSLGKLVPVRPFDKKGLPGFWGAAGTKDFLFWGSQYSIYGLAEAGIPEEIGLAIRDTWQGFSASQKQNSIAAYHRNQNEFFIFANGVSYIYDRDKGTWKSLNSTAWTWLTDGVDGELLVSDGTDIYELLSDSPTENLIATYQRDWEFETDVEFRQFWLNFESTTLIKVFLYDLEESNSNPIIEPLLFFPQSVPETQKERATFRAQRIRVKIEKQSSIDQDFKLNSYSVFGNPLEQISES